MLIMSETLEIDTAESSGTENHQKKYELPPSLREKLQDIPEALEFIKLLEKQIKKQKKKLKKLRTKFKVNEKNSVAKFATKTDSCGKNLVAELVTKNDS